MRNMLRSSNGPQICRKCLNRAGLPAQRVLDLPSLQRQAIRYGVPHRSGCSASFATTTTSSETSTNPKVSSFGPSNFTTNRGAPHPSARKPPQSVRERLLQWKPDNNVDFYSQQDDMSLHGKEPNMASRAQSSGSRELDLMRPIEAGMTDSPNDGKFINHASGDEEVGIDSRQPGDLVEVRQHGTRLPIFAVYLGYLGGRHHFYASTGRWIMTMHFGSLFTVSNFATMEELMPILKELPKCETPSEFDAARYKDLGPSRATASHLINKMNQFTANADTVYLSHTDKLDAARVLLADKHRVKYLSLFEIAELLLPASLKEGDKYPPYALYAAHTALYRDEIVFRPISPTSDCHRRDHLFEIFPSSFTSTIDRVATVVRNYTTTISQMTDMSGPNAMKGTAFGTFVQKVQQVVRENRKERGWTSHGICAPSDKPVKIQRAGWSQTDKDILNYLQWWAMYDLFEPSSRFAAYGATILRALGLYEGVPLDESVAWTLMQELGIFQPWEVPSRYKVRFPGTVVVEGGGLARTKLPQIEESRRADLAAGHRVDMRGSTVFCIDGPETVMIDDGVSLERTAHADEFWVHVHVADPASGILPRSGLRDYMELIPENIYLPGHFQAMLSQPSGGAPSGETQDLVNEYSLRDESPALTFSTKMNRAGDILDYHIKPSQIGKVVYLDPADVAGFCGEARKQPKVVQEIAVGTPPLANTEKSRRIMTTPEDLVPAHRDDLLVLFQLGAARREQRLVKGAWPYFFQQPYVKVQFHDLPKDSAKATGVALQPPDPYIKVSNKPQPESSLVTNAMVLAGEVAARWLADRGIPAPFRQDSKSFENYEQAYDYATTHIYPNLLQGIEATTQQINQLGVLTGGYRLDTKPGPSFMMGLDMYVKVTSPLRRFSDMLAHWQIHAALAYERETGRPLNLLEARGDEPATAVLAFSEAELSNTLSLLQMREKMARRVSRSDREWILIALVRMWQFEKSVPETFRFKVESSWRPGLVGELDWFGVRATMEAGHLGEQALLSKIRVGDEFDVELVDVNVVLGVVEVRAVRYLGSRTASSELPGEPQAHNVLAQ